MVRVVGVEPTRLAAQEPKSCTSANSAIPAHGPAPQEVPESGCQSESTSCIDIHFYTYTKAKRLALAQPLPLFRWWNQTAAAQVPAMVRLILVMRPTGALQRAISCPVHSGPPGADAPCCHLTSLRGKSQIAFPPVIFGIYIRIYPVNIHFCRKLLGNFPGIPE